MAAYGRGLQPWPNKSTHSTSTNGISHPNIRRKWGSCNASEHWSRSLTILWRQFQKYSPPSGHRTSISLENSRFWIAAECQYWYKRTNFNSITFLWVGIALVHVSLWSVYNIRFWFFPSLLDNKQNEQSFLISNWMWLHGVAIFVSVSVRCPWER